MEDKLGKLLLILKPLTNSYQKAADSTYGRLIRMSSYHVYLLLFLPTWCAIWMADKNDDLLQRFLLCLVFAIGTFLTRSAGCIINDIFDKQFDGKVERTKSRPLVTGNVKPSEAMVIASVMLGLSAIILLVLPSRVFYVGIIAVIMMIIYPLSKRFTNLPQLVLGFTFNLGILMAWLTVSDSQFFQLSMLYIAFSLLTFGYDTIYACQDIEDDEAAGVKSFPLFIKSGGREIKDVVWHIYKLSFTCFGIAGLGTGLGSSFYLSLAGSLYIISNSLDNSNIEDANSCYEHFKKVTLVLSLLFLGIVFSR